MLEHGEQGGDARERAGRCRLGHRTGVCLPPVRRPPSGGRNSRGVTACSLQLDSRSHPARRGLLPGHPAGDGDMGLRSGEVSDEKGEAYETRSQVPCPWRHGHLARRRGAAAAATPKCPLDSVKVGTACIDTYEASIWSIPPSNTLLVFAFDRWPGATPAAHSISSSAAPLATSKESQRRNPGSSSIPSSVSEWRRPAWLVKRT